MRRAILFCIAFTAAILAMAIGCSAPTKVVAQSPHVDMDFGQGFFDLTTEFMAQSENASLAAFRRVRGVGEPCRPEVCDDIGEDTSCVFGPAGSRQVLMQVANGFALAEYDEVSNRLVRNSHAIVPGSPMAWVDIDGDEMPDIAVNHGGLSIHWGDGAQTTRLLDRGRVTGLHVGDLNGDGLPDVLLSLSCNSGVPQSVYAYFQGPRRVFTERSIVQSNWCHSGYAVWAGKLGYESFIVVAAGGADHDSFPPSMYREVRRDADRFPVYEPYDKEPRALYYGPSYTPAEAKVILDDACFSGEAAREWCNPPRSQDEAYRLLSEEDSKGASWAARAAMGIAVGDISGSGKDSMLVTLNTDHFTAHYTESGFIDVTRATMFPADGYMEGHQLNIPWGAAFLPLRRTEILDAVLVYGNDYTRWREVGNNHLQPTRIFANDGRGVFTDVSERAGVSLRGQWKSLAVGDLLGDGSPDICVGGQSLVPRVLKNMITNGRNGLSLRLIGKRGNTVDMHARAEIEVSGLPRQTRRPDGIGSPGVFSEPLVFVGLGTSAVADLIRVRWSSGQVSKHRGLVAGTVHMIKEP